MNKILQASDKNITYYTMNSAHDSINNNILSLPMEQQIEFSYSDAKFNLIDDVKGGWSAYRIQQRSWEDRYQAQKFGKWLFYAVFDGHGLPNNFDDAHVVDFVCKNYHKWLAYELENTSVLNAINKTCLDIDKLMLYCEMKGGCTFSGLLIDTISNTKYVINAGDSRTILYNYDDIVFSTLDHTPLKLNEKNRILQSGHSIIQGRIDDVLNVCRGFGDFDFKYDVFADYDGVKSAVSVVPDIKIINDDDPVNGALLATDGFFDVYGNDRLFEQFNYNIGKCAIYSNNCQTDKYTVLKYTCEYYKRYTTDDMTLMYVQL